MSDEKRSLEEESRRADEILKSKPFKYWIPYKIIYPDKPLEESTTECGNIELKLVLFRTKPEDAKYIDRAIREFRNKKQDELNQNSVKYKSVNILGAYLYEDECQKKVDKENKLQEEVKQHNRTQALHKP